MQEKQKENRQVCIKIKERRTNQERKYKKEQLTRRVYMEEKQLGIMPDTMQKGSNELDKKVCKKRRQELGKKIYNKSCKKLGKNVCKKGSKELRKRVTERSSQELGKKLCNKSSNEPGKKARK